MQMEMTGYEKRTVEAENASEEMAEYVKELENENTNYKKEMQILKQKCDSQTKTYTEEINEIKRLSTLSIKAITNDKNYEPMQPKKLDSQCVIGNDIITLSSIVKNTFTDLCDVVQTNAEWLNGKIITSMDRHRAKIQEKEALMGLIGKQTQTINDLSRQLSKTTEYLKKSIKLNESAQKEISNYKETMDGSNQKCNKFIEYILQQLYEEQIDTQENFISKIKQKMSDYSQGISQKRNEISIKQQELEMRYSQLEKINSDKAQMAQEQNEEAALNKYKHEIIKLNEESSKLLQEKALLAREYEQNTKTWEVDKQCLESKVNFLENEATGLKRIIEEAKQNLMQTNQIAEKFRDMAMSSKAQLISVQEKLVLSEKYSTAKKDKMMDSIAIRSSTQITTDG